jgi:hypothetical protein
MRVHVVWGLGRPQLGLETAGAACWMTILQNVSAPTDRNFVFARPHVLNAARVMQNWFFMVALILWPGVVANWLAGGNGKIEKKWGPKTLRSIVT